MMYYRTLTAFFPGRTEAAGALGRLLALGVAAEDISMVPKQHSRLDELELTIHSKASEGAALGAVIGGLVGGALAAITAGGALIIPRLDAFLAGPIVACLAGAGAAGAAGTLLGAVLGARLPEYEARRLDEASGAGGGAVLSVRCLPDVSRTVEEVLSESGGRRIRKTYSRRA
ncbi:hypothetical protein WMF26_48335 [Sorangium sp. So ce185]|uniref:hypothetical protein n=1 Tax=Sorangium sp. So ce185 TaxID=3133287 RepID=UPI003F61EB47